MNREQKRKFGKYLRSELENMTHSDLMKIITGQQDEENIILMTDSYKLTHHAILPEGLEEVYSYLESRGGEMPYTVFFGLQYYLMKYLAGVRVTQENIDQAHKKSIEHFGFDCFNREMWQHILDVHGGILPIRIKAVPEGTVVSVKNILMSIVNTDKKCAALTNAIETLIMKVWYTNTVAAYSRHIKEVMHKYWKKTSDAPEWLLDFMLHDFGYRGVSSEETAGLGSAADFVNFKGSDTMAGNLLVEKYYGPCEMATFSVIASEHSVMCAYGGKNDEAGAYKTIIERVKKKYTKIRILSLVSDTYNIYRVCYTILPGLQGIINSWFHEDGSPVKVVIRPDSGDPRKILFGDPSATADDETVKRVARDYDAETALMLVKKGVFKILAEKFGSTINSKGYTVLNPHVGVLQGDGISLETIKLIYERMLEEKFDSMGLVFGSGGKLLQAHDRDEQKYAIKATYVKINGKGRAVMKDPATDKGKTSKLGYLKLVENEDGSLRTSEMDDEDFDILNDKMETVFENGEIKKFYTFDEVRENAKLVY